LRNRLQLKQSVENYEKMSQKVIKNWSVSVFSFRFSASDKEMKGYNWVKKSQKHIFRT
jgi:hypothetical protein